MGNAPVGKLTGPYSSYAADGSGDRWGYLPFGMNKPPQHVWSSWYSRGAAAFTNPAGGLGLNNDPLTEFGVYEAAVPPKPHFVYSNLFPAISRQSLALIPGTFGSPGLAAQDICSSETFPNCQMTAPRNNAPQVYLWDNLKEPIDLTDLWAEKTRDLTAAYSAGHFEGLKHVNQIDPNELQTCWNQEGILEEILPPVGALAAAGVCGFVANTMIPFPLPRIIIGTSIIAPFLTVYNFLNYDLSRNIFSPNDPQTVNDLNRTVFFLLAGAGFFAGGGAVALATGEDSRMYLVAGAATGAAMYYFLKAPVTVAIEGSTWGGSALLKIVDWFSSLWKGVECETMKVFTGSSNPCIYAAMDPTARRWDAASLAAMLTDVACEEEGWKRDDPRAEFVYQGLLTGIDLPALGYASKNLSNATSIDGLGLNPLGEIWPFPVLSDEGMPPGYNWFDRGDVFACSPWELLYQKGTTTGDQLRFFKTNLVNSAKSPAALEKAKHIYDWNTFDPIYKVGGGTSAVGDVPTLQDDCWHMIQWALHNGNTITDIGSALQYGGVDTSTCAPDSAFLVQFLIDFNGFGISDGVYGLGDVYAAYLLAKKPGDENKYTRGRVLKFLISDDWINAITTGRGAQFTANTYSAWLARTKITAAGSLLYSGMPPAGTEMSQLILADRTFVPTGQQYEQIREQQLHADYVYNAPNAKPGNAAFWQIQDILTEANFQFPGFDPSK